MQTKILVSIFPKKSCPQNKKMTARLAPRSRVICFCAWIRTSSLAGAPRQPTPCAVCVLPYTRPRDHIIKAGQGQTASCKIDHRDNPGLCRCGRAHWCPNAWGGISPQRFPTSSKDCVFLFAGTQWKWLICEVFALAALERTLRAV